MRSIRGVWRACPIALGLSLLMAGGGFAAAPALKGDTQIHDPSVIEAGGKWASFQTGEEGGLYQGAILVKTSPDGITWTKAGAIGKGVPKWTADALGYKSRNIWAPTISRRGDTFYLYYSVSSFGLNQSVIGLMTNTAFDPSKPGEGWTDQGLVIASTLKDDFNAIDPFRIDLSDGTAWLSYGSYWSGIKLRQLDPESGKLSGPDEPVYDIASRGRGAIEASSLLEHDGKFYLFVSYDRCCAGVASTYRIMVGRADTITGPYVDRDGTPMMKSGATELQRTHGRYIGPGGEEPVANDNDEELLAYHYYDGEDLGKSKLQIAPITWTDDGWPELAPPP
jgi:arabinan endo-1,5-alpha-L-arabinosidase